jgi:shikimate dehydrogenase
MTVVRLPGRLVLIGHPVSHSLSPKFQNAALADAGIALAYEAVDVEPEHLASTARSLAEANAAGNVTVPFKEAFAECCAELSPVARRTGAVNTFWTEAGELHGDNTDVGGFDAAIRATFRFPAAPFEVAVLGAGGSASAVLAAIERWEGATARVWSRTMARAERLVARFGRVARAEWSIDAAVRGAALVVNATPVGMSNGDLPVDPALLDDGATAFDLVYRRGATAFVHACVARGLRASDGLPMLIEQGALAFERWFDRAPNRAVMREAAR